MSFAVRINDPIKTTLIFQRGCDVLFRVTLQDGSGNAIDCTDTDPPAATWYADGTQTDVEFTTAWVDASAGICQVSLLFEHNPPLITDAEFPARMTWRLTWTDAQARRWLLWKSALEVEA